MYSGETYLARFYHSKSSRYYKYEEGPPLKVYSFQSTKIPQQTTISLANVLHLMLNLDLFLGIFFMKSGNYVDTLHNNIKFPPSGRYLKLHIEIVLLFHCKCARDNDLQVNRSRLIKFFLVKTHSQSDDMLKIHQLNNVVSPINSN